MLNADLGYNTKNIIRCMVIPAKNTDAIISDMKAWEREREQDKRNAAHITHTLNSCPDIIAWSGSDELWNASSSNYPIGKKAGTDNNSPKEAFLLSRLMTSAYSIWKSWKDEDGMTTSTSFHNTDSSSMNRPRKLWA